MMDLADAVQTKGVGVSVLVFEIIVNRPLEVDDGVERAATDALSGDLGEEALDRIDRDFL